MVIDGFLCLFLQKQQPAARNHQVARNHQLRQGVCPHIQSHQAARSVRSEHAECAICDAYVFDGPTDAQAQSDNSCRNWWRLLHGYGHRTSKRCGRTPELLHAVPGPEWHSWDISMGENQINEKKNKTRPLLITRHTTN